VRAITSDPNKKGKLPPDEYNRKLDEAIEKYGDVGLSFDPETESFKPATVNLPTAYALDLYDWIDYAMGGGDPNDPLPLEQARNAMPYFEFDRPENDGWDFNVQNLANAARRKLGLAQSFSSEAKKDPKSDPIVIDLSDKKMGYQSNPPFYSSIKENPDFKADAILGGDFIEHPRRLVGAIETSANQSSLADFEQLWSNSQPKTKKEWAEMAESPDNQYKGNSTIVIPTIEGGRYFDTSSGRYYGVEDGRLVAGELDKFKDSTVIVPLRQNPNDIATSYLWEDESGNTRFRMVDSEGNPIFSTQDEGYGKMILYSPETDRSVFIAGGSPEAFHNETQKFLNDNNGSAFPILLDTGSYGHYSKAKEGESLKWDDYLNYMNTGILGSQSSVPFQTGYNLLVYGSGGRLFNRKKSKQFNFLKSSR